MRRVLALVCVAVLAACEGEQHSDLKSELTELTKDLRGRVDPLPQVRPYEPVPYQAEGEVDPFRPDRIEVAAAPGATAKVGGVQPNLDRPKEPLEEFPLDALRMVGTITMQQRAFALIRAPDAVVHRVSVGDHLGQNYGKITGISETEVVLMEIIPDGLGGYIQRPASVALTQ